MILSTVTGFLWIWRNPKLWEFLKINLQKITQKLTTRSSPVVDFSRTRSKIYEARSPGAGVTEEDRGGGIVCHPS